MKKYFLCTSLLFFFSSCHRELLKTKKKEVIVVKPGPLIQTINDSTFRYDLVHKKWIDVSIINSADRFSMLVNRSGVKDSIDFDKEHITAKTPEFEWMNHQFICITTWVSGPFSSSLIVPVKRQSFPYIYFVKGILTADTKNNLVVYSERIYGKEKVQFAIENLQTRKKQFVDWHIPKNQSEFPYCDSLMIQNDQLLIWNNRQLYSFKWKVEK